MPVQPPTRQQLEWIADALHMQLTEEELDVFEEVDRAGRSRSSGAWTSCPTSRCRCKYPREDLGHRPVGDENPSNGWAWKCSIRGAAAGALAGRTVGVKDNVCVAGMPMLNGSPIMEGYVPREDATVVTRLLDAGAHIVGKTAVPAFCFDGGGLTGYPDPQPVNPHNPAYLAGASSNGSAVVIVDGRGGPGARRRPGRLDPDAGVVERVLRAQADARPRAVHRDLPDRADARPHRADGPDRGRLRR